VVIVGFTCTNQGWFREGKMSEERDEECYHYGLTIREFRKQVGMTQAHLAELWPTGSVTPEYVQRVERGINRIADNNVLRRLGEILDIPLWRFGLSEYDPFSPHNLPGRGVRMYKETLDTVECFIEQTWSLRCAAMMPNATMCLARLNTFFSHFRRELPPPSQLEERFLQLYAQVQRLNAIASVERKDYEQAIVLYEGMHETAKQLQDPVALSLVEMSIGSELARAKRLDDAVSWLEQARDSSFQASKHVAAFVHSYLARAYAGAGDVARFERAVDMAYKLATSVDDYGNGTDYVYGKLSSVLAEKSWGYVQLGQAQKVLDMRDEIAQQIDLDRDLRLRAWIPLDWARANLQLGEVEHAVSEAREYYQRVSDMGSAHAERQAYKFVLELEDAGYSRVEAVRDFRGVLLQR